MSHGPDSGSTRRAPRVSWLALAWLAALLTAPPARAGDPPRDPQVGTIDVAIPAKAKTPPDDPEAAERILSRTGNAPEGGGDWHAAYVRDPTGAVPAEAQATLAIARDSEYGRAQTIHDLTAGGTRVQPLVKSLDVGRHELLKVLYHRAMVLANERLAKDGLSPLQKVQAVNAGGTGDYTRDQDITVFTDDPERERYFFEAVKDVAASDDIRLKTDVKPTGGIDFPEIEVTFFRGSNDLPDARFATDVEEFALKYMKAIANQAADREAYKGGGAEIEVKGRRVPGKMYVQQFTWQDGKPVYVAETPQNFREAASIFSGTAPERWQRFERAAHIFSDFIQGRQHSEGAGHELTKGPLKYAGRAIEHLCELHGMKPWKDLKPEDRVVLLRKVWPHLDPKSEHGKRVLGQISDALDVAVHVKTKKEMKPGTGHDAAERADKIALAFLRNATGVTLSKMAQDLVNPPAFDSRAMRALAGPAWDRMSPVERFRFAVERDKVYRAASGRAAMENLLVAVSLLRAMDSSDGKPARDRPGEHLIAKAMAGAPPELRPILGLASEYSEAWARRQQTSDPLVRAECDKTIADVRRRMVVHCPLVGGTMPGEALLAKAAAAGPRAVLAAETGRGSKGWLSPEMREVKEAFGEHLKSAFPSLSEEWKGFRNTVEEIGWKGYVSRRLADEFLQWDTVADGLTLIEMYQNNAGWKDYGKFLSINLLSRVHWGLGPLAQAFDVWDADPSVAAKKAKELGKSLVFMTLARVVPWASSVKIAFDVARGTVVVTVGWAVGKANQWTIDALYTGEAGRLGEGAAGKAAGRLRDSGVSVLSKAHVRRVVDPDAKTESLAVDPDAVYMDFVRRWTGADPDEVPRASAPSAASAGFVRAHDDFVKILLKQAEQHGPTWVQKPGAPFFPLRLSEKEVEEALTALEPHIRENAAKEVERVLSETAVRGYRSYLDEEGTDVIKDGLLRRFSCDVLGGLIEHWQVRLTAQILAARDLERTAVFADFRALAAELHKKYVPSETRVAPIEMRLQGGRMRPVRKAGGMVSFESADAGGGGDSSVSFELKASVAGVPVLGGTALDGSQPLHLGAMLVGCGEMGDAEKPVRFEVTTQRLKKVRGEGEDGDDVLRPGDVVEDKVVVRALAADGAGPELATTEIPLKVLLPEEEGLRKVPLYRHESRRGDGRLYERYVYAKWEPGLPRDWKSEDGEIYHGDYEVFQGDGTTRAEVRRFRFGRLHGKSETFDSKGRLNHEIPYEDGVTHGDDVRYDPDSSGRQVTRYDRGRVMEETTTHANGGPASKITYAYEDHSTDDSDVTVRGDAAQWWSSGKKKWAGRFELRGRFGIDVRPFEEQGGSRGENVGKKVGVWEWFHPNGQPMESHEFRNGVLEGPSRSWDEKGRLRSEGRHVGGEKDGRWTAWEYDDSRGKVRRLWSTYQRGKPSGRLESEDWQDAK